MQNIFVFIFYFLCKIIIKNIFFWKTRFCTNIWLLNFQKHTINDENIWFFKSKTLTFDTLCCSKFVQKVVICPKTGLTSNLVLRVKTLDTATTFGKSLFTQKCIFLCTKKRIFYEKTIYFFTLKTKQKYIFFTSVCDWYLTLYPKLELKINPKSMKHFPFFFHFF